jgi:transposase
VDTALHILYTLRFASAPSGSPKWLTTFVGVPAYRLRFHKNLPTKHTIEKVFHWFRELIYEHQIHQLTRLSGKVELDEAMFGGKRIGKRGWGAEGKVVVFGIYQRNGKVLTFPVPNRRKVTLLPLVNKHIQKGSVYYTDDYEGYASLATRGKHLVILKEKGKPLPGPNINGIEGFWSTAKHWLYHYRGIHKTNFSLYLKEIEWRFNNRGKPLLPILLKLIRS